MSIAFCNIAKAYDSVNRELFYNKLNTIRFGGKVKYLIQSMYFNDSVRVRIKGCLTVPLWFTKDVKQGCDLSPLLFSLLMTGLGVKLHAIKEGINFNGQVIFALFCGLSSSYLTYKGERNGKNVKGGIKVLKRNAYEIVY